MKAWILLLAVIHSVEPGSLGNKCPAVFPKSRLQCAGREQHSCWSVGVRDLDCPGAAPCCFDGCGNHCLLDKPKTRTPIDPCSPSPCGPGTNCQVNAGGNPVCFCNPGLIPKPDTITGCGPECTVDPECRGGLVCINQRCTIKPDPCNPSPCGPGTICQTNRNGNPVCQCRAGLVPKPDTITGCGPECVVDADCRGGLVCLNQKCSQRPDPCDPSPCGPGTTCETNRNGNPVCQCKPGLVPKPDTITGCGPECVIDRDCRSGLVCLSQKCSQIPDPCEPSPCGPNTSCKPNSQGNPVCHCLAGFIPKPDTITGCGYECVRDADCKSGYICTGNRCVVKPDPCDPSPCGPGTSCEPNLNGNPVCKCLRGLVPKPDTITGCGPECERDPDCRRGYICQSGKCVEKPDPCDPSPCGPGAMCMVNSNGNPVCRCQEGLVPKPDTITGCGPECVVDRDCNSGYICQSQKCVVKPDPCDPSPCGEGAICEEGRNGDATCRCEPGLLPKPDPFIKCGPECIIDRDCNQGYICNNTRCVIEPDPCRPNPCGDGAICSKTGRSPFFSCECPDKYVGDPNVRCKRIIVIGSVNPPRALEPKARTPFVIGHTASGGFTSSSVNRRPVTVSGGNNGNRFPEPEVLAIGRNQRPPTSRRKTVIGASYSSKF